MGWIELGTDDGHRLAAWRAEPQGKARGGLIVVQEIFGVNSHIRAVADRFAREGYLAIAPALFDRIERGVELAYDEAGFARGRALAAQLDYDLVVRDVAAARDQAGAAGRVAIVGYCYGGGVAWIAAARLEGLACAVSYYGSRIAGFFEAEPPHTSVMMHVGRNDASFPLETVHAIGRRYPEVVIHEYDAGHGFSCDQRGDHHAASAALALERTLAFFDEHVAR